MPITCLPPPLFVNNLSHQNWTCFLILKILGKNVCRPKFKTYFKKLNNGTGI
jgi:hypothetical protein